MLNIQVHIQVAIPIGHQLPCLHLQNGGDVIQFVLLVLNNNAVRCLQWCLIHSQSLSVPLPTSSGEFWSTSSVHFPYCAATAAQLGPQFPFQGERLGIGE